MAPKKDKGKKKIETPKSLTSKPIKSWADIAEEEEAQAKAPQSQSKLPPKDLQIYDPTFETFEQIAKLLAHSPDVLKALTTHQAKEAQIQAQSESSGNNSKLISKTEKGDSSLSKPLSQQDISSSSQQIVLSQYKLPTQRTEYLINPIPQNIITIEPGHENMDPWICMDLYFKHWYYKPWDLGRDYSYYQSILEDTDSAKFKHFIKNDEYSYSTCTILSVKNYVDWGNPNTLMELKAPGYRHKLNIPTTFNYWDYQQAWFNSFFIQNSKHSHSWLIYFSTKTDLNSFPSWFLQWWAQFGAIPEILPPEAQASFKLFKAHYTPKPLEKRFEPLCVFMTKFFVPWVCQWFLDYRIINGTSILQRRYKVKWWSSFRTSEKISESIVMDWLKKNDFLNPIQASPETLFLAQKSHASARLHAAKSEEEYFTIMAQLLQSRSSGPSSTAGSKPEDETSDSDPELDLGNDNEDDCFGILPSLKTKATKKK